MPLVGDGTEARRDNRISAMLRGKRGRIESRISVYGSDVSGAQGDHVEGLEEESVSVSMSNYRDWTWELSARVQDNTTFGFVGGYLKAVLEVRAGGTREPWERFPVGHYRVAAVRRDHDVRTSQEIVCHSLESAALGDAFVPEGLLVEAGTGVLAECRRILTTMRPAIPPERIRFPTEDEGLTTDVFFDALQDAGKCRKLRVINELFNAGGFGALYADGEGYLATDEIQELSGETPDVFYSTSEAKPVSGRRGPLSPERLVTTATIPDEDDDERFANRIVVISGDPNQRPPIWAVAENNDPNHPLSIPNVGIVQPDPISLTTATSQPAARRLANAALRRASSRYRRASITTPPDGRRGPRETYLTSLRLADGGPAAPVALSGHWRVIGWTLSGGAMVHDLARVEGARDLPSGHAGDSGGLA